MRTQCNAEQLQFSCVERRRVVAAFDGGQVTSDAGALLLLRTDRAIRLIDRLAGCFVDRRSQVTVEHGVRTLLAQRVLGIAAGYEDLNDHDALRRDPLWGALIGKLEAKRSDCAPLAGKSTLNRLELSVAERLTRYHRIGHVPEALERLFVDLFLEAHRKAPRQIVLDLDATDDPLHGEQEGRFFHGYYDGYCYLPLYIFCGRHLLAAKLRRSNLDASSGAVEEVERLVAQIRARWPAVRILLRADSGFAREALMAWCEQHAVDYVFGLARNKRLERILGRALHEARQQARRSGRPARVFRDFRYRTRNSWSRRRRVIGKAEHLGDKANPRYLVTSLTREEWPAQRLYERLYCARGEMENRIKEAPLELFADRTSSHTFRANQLRLWLASFAYVLLEALRRLGLAATAFATATAGTIRLKLLKIGALITVSVRRVKLAMSSAHPHQREFRTAFHALGAAAR
ncbi:MAG: IS1380 family transposase [Steroidobacteraceae bacterium]